jgi:hypothetical protein
MHFFHAELENCGRVTFAILVEVVLAVITARVDIARRVQTPAFVIMRALRLGHTLEHEGGQVLPRRFVNKRAPW